jgi:hypothetical protein
MAGATRAQDSALDAAKERYNKRILKAWEIPEPKYEGGKDEKPIDYPQSELLRRGLLFRRLRAAQRDLNTQIEVCRTGINSFSFERMAEAMKRYTEADVACLPLALIPSPDDHVRAYDRAAKLAEAVEEYLEFLLKAGHFSQHDLDVIRYHRLSMQIKLLEAKRDAEAKNQKK